MKDAKSSRAEEPASTALQSQTNPPGHILVVDDDLFLRRLNIKVLVRSGYEVDAAADGAVAWQALNTGSYDLLITENSLPKVSGVELLKNLRAARMALPVIMATGTLPKEEFTRYPPAPTCRHAAQALYRRADGENGEKGLAPSHGAKRPARDRQRQRADQAVSRWFMAAMIYRGNPPRLTPP